MSNGRRVAGVGFLVLLTGMSFIVALRPVRADSKCDFNSWELERVSIESATAPQELLDLEDPVWRDSGTLSDSGGNVTVSGCRCGMVIFE